VFCAKRLEDIEGTGLEICGSAEKCRKVQEAAGKRADSRQLTVDSRTDPGGSKARRKKEKG
jgi:hypothetical protein